MKVFCDDSVSTETRTKKIIKNPKAQHENMDMFPWTAQECKWMRTLAEILTGTSMNSLLKTSQKVPISKTKGILTPNCFDS